MKEHFIKYRFHIKAGKKIAKNMISFAMQQNNKFLLGKAYYYLAQNMYFSNNFREGKNYCMQSINILQNEVLCEEYALSCNLLGIMASIQGNQVTAMDWFLKGPSYCDSLGDLNVIGGIYINIADLYMNIRDYETAIKFLKKAKKYIKEKTEINALRIYYIHVNLAYCYNGLDKPQKLHKEYEKVKQLFNSGIMHSRDIINFLMVQSLVLCREDDDEAFNNCAKSLLENLDADINMENFAELLAASKYWMRNGKTQFIEKVFDFCREQLKRYKLDNLYTEYYSCLIEYNRLTGKDNNCGKLALLYYDANDLNINMGRKAVAENLRDKIELYEMEKKYSLMKETANTDPLTGLYNRNAFKNIIAGKFEFSKAKNEEIGVSFIDVDYFKEYNDCYGHIEGDNYLKAISREILNICDEKTTAIRYGGDEFLILFCGYSYDYVKEKLYQLNDNINALKIPHLKCENGLASITQGVYHAAAYADEGFYDYILKADRALYKGKEGRGSIVIETRNK